MTSDYDQAEVLVFLARATTHGLGGPVQRIDTHGAAVFLAGPDVYKVKRAVRYPYMDFSTLEKRRRACEAEVAINRIFAPDIYLGVVPITRMPAGLELGGGGPAVEWAVHMRRFDESTTFDKLAELGGLDPLLLESLAKTVSESHQKAARSSDAVLLAMSLRDVIAESLDELKARPDLFDAQRVETLSVGLLDTFHRNAGLMIKRARQGKIRRCHGDLHLRNIALVDNHPVLFDALEFDETLATIDILYDLAFLVMDLCERRLRQESCQLLNFYIWHAADEAGEVQGLALLPLFQALRAAIRAKVAATQADLAGQSAGLRQEARQYLDAAVGFLIPSAVSLIAVGGLSGSGKSSLAAALAPALGGAPGALHLRSDIERKNICGVGASVRLGTSAYGAPATAQVYQRLFALADDGLRAGRCVIVDATFQEGQFRREIEAIARRRGIPFFGLWLDAPLETLRRRVAERKNDASDATPDVVSAQAAHSVPPSSWTIIDASPALSTIRSRVLELLSPK